MVGARLSQCILREGEVPPAVQDIQEMDLGPNQPDSEHVLPGRGVCLQVPCSLPPLPAAGLGADDEEPGALAAAAAAALQRHSLACCVHLLAVQHLREQRGVQAAQRLAERRNEPLVIVRRCQRPGAAGVGEVRHQQQVHHGCRTRGHGRGAIVVAWLGSCYLTHRPVNSQINVTIV